MKSLIKKGLIAFLFFVSINVQSQSMSGNIKSVKITYLETGNNTEGTNAFINKKETTFNGCLDYKISKLIIEGSAKKITISIKEESGKVIYEKKDLDIEGSLSINLTIKDRNVLNNLFFGGSVIIKQKKLFYSAIKPLTADVINPSSRSFRILGAGYNLRPKIPAAFSYAGLQ